MLHKTTTPISIHGLLLPLFVGVVFLSISLLFIFPLFFGSHKDWIETQGTIIDLNQTSFSSRGPSYSPIYRFTDKNNIERQAVSTSWESGMAVGDLRTIRYNAFNPEQIEVESSGWIKLLVLIFPAAGLLIIISSLRTYTSYKRRKSLISTGQPLDALVAKESFTDMSTKRAKTITVIAAMPDGTAKEFISDPITLSQFLALQDSQGDVLAKVYLDPSNPKRYFVTLPELPQANAHTILSLVNKAKTNFKQ